MKEKVVSSVEGIQKLLKFEKWKKVKVKSLSCVRLFATPWTVAYQASLSMRFSRQEYWNSEEGEISGRAIWHDHFGLDLFCWDQSSLMCMESVVTPLSMAGVTGWLWTWTLYCPTLHYSVTNTGMGEPGGLPSMGSHKIGHNWSDLAAAAAGNGRTIGIKQKINRKTVDLNITTLY